MTPTTDCGEVAAFDLDGTLVRAHTLVRFLHRVGGFGGLARAVVTGAFASGVPPRRVAFKEASIGAILAGRAIDEVRAEGRRFADALYRDRLNRPTVEILEVHRAHGTRSVMVTAALDVYAEPLAELLGMDAMLATRVDHRDGYCTGRLTDDDMTGSAKVDRLRLWLGECADRTRVHAYGDSRQDEPLLAYARSTRP